MSWDRSVPVALFLYKRPVQTERVFAAIARAKPKRLFLIADGPKSKAEVQRCQQAQSVADRVDWDCEVLTRFSTVNLGCKNRIVSGLSWVFEQAEDAIILEDDCLPDVSFFRFCEELLERYRTDDRIMTISGSNFQFGNNETEYSYYFSRYFHCWGWATWRRVHDLYDPDIESWPTIDSGNWMAGTFRRTAEQTYWSRVFERVYRKEIDTWDYSMCFLSLTQNGLNLIPKRNLVENIGFGPGGTHFTGRNEVRTARLDAIRFPLTHPRFMIPHDAADAYTSREHFGIRPMYARLFRRFVRLLSTLRHRGDSAGLENE